MLTLIVLQRQECKKGCPVVRSSQSPSFAMASHPYNVLGPNGQALYRSKPYRQGLRILMLTIKLVLTSVAHSQIAYISEELCKRFTEGTNLAF